GHDGIRQEVLERVRPVRGAPDLRSAARPELPPLRQEALGGLSGRSCFSPFTANQCLDFGPSLPGARKVQYGLAGSRRAGMPPSRARPVCPCSSLASGGRGASFGSEQWLEPASPPWGTPTPRQS